MHKPKRKWSQAIHQQLHLITDSQIDHFRSLAVKSGLAMVYDLNLGAIILRNADNHCEGCKLETGKHSHIVGALLRPDPQYGAITQTHTAGKTIHVHSYKLHAQRPFFKGLSFLVAYAYQREARTEFFDDRAEYARGVCEAA